jgi:cytosine/adenosine deaminase-related metal-dependent hydrolase
MQPRWCKDVTFINADLAGHRVGSLRVEQGRIAALDVPPQPDDCVVDLQGDRLLPGLINAHDHLQFNGFPRLEYPNPYRNAREWVTDVNARAQQDRAFAACAALPRDSRLWIGGLKNILSGVTTVAHHDRLDPFLTSSGFPTSVVTRYGWSHSLYIDDEEQVCASWRNTPSDQPWIIHAAEGLDDLSAQEFERLDAMGCIQQNTLIVHGIALGEAQRLRLEEVGAGLIWCPSSNLRLFGQTAEVSHLLRSGRVALGTDSRLTGARDLLEELRIAREISRLEDPLLQGLVTEFSARLLRLSDRGTLEAGSRADLVVLPAHIPLGQASRSDLRLVMLAGAFRYGDLDCARILRAGLRCTPIRVDDRIKMLDSRLVESLSRLNVIEHGVELLSESQGRREHVG